MQQRNRFDFVSCLLFCRQLVKVVNKCTIFGFLSAKTQDMHTKPPRNLKLNRSELSIKSQLSTI